MGVMVDFACGLAAFALAILVGTLSKLLADDAKAWTPHVTKAIIASAVKMLPERHRERFSEEWTSHINDVPGDLSKIVCALGYVSAARKFSSAPLPFGRRAYLAVLGMFFILLYLPLLVGLLAGVALDTRTWPIIKQERVGLHGKRFATYRFRASESAFGQFIRRCSFDIMPCLFNILRGDISLFGPTALPPQLIERGVLVDLSKLPGLVAPSQEYLSEEWSARTEIAMISSFWLTVFKAFDLAPKFYPDLSSFGRLDVPIRAVVAAGAGAELSA